MKNSEFSDFEIKILFCENTDYVEIDDEVVPFECVDVDIASIDDNDANVRVSFLVMQLFLLAKKYSVYFVKVGSMRAKISNMNYLRIYAII